MTRRRTSLRWAIVLCGALGLAACGRAAQQDSAPASAAEAPAGEVWTQKSEVGPVQVTVTLAPKRPRLGDPLTLTLTVDAQAGVHVEMPPFGDALGRFSIASFTPRSESTANGGTRHSQRYVLEAPMSGRQRVPSLRIEFADNRPGTGGAGRADGGAEEATHEILTDEIAVDVASVLPAGDGKTDELRGLREPLPESIGATRWLQLAPIPIALLSIVVAYGLVRRMRTRAQQRVRASAYDVAMARLSALRGRGFPGEEDADPFYVDLSDIVRRLNKEFVLLLGLALLIAFPLAHYAIARWLEGFAYHTDVSPMLYVLALLFTLVVMVVTVTVQAYRAAVADPIVALRQE